jgi:hypothetical protein
MVPVDDGLVPAGRPVGLEAAPTIVGGVAAPSEIAVGVPNDLDLICRMTLGGGRRGPVSPGDLALQIAPWPAEQPSSDGATGIGLRNREELEPTRVLPAMGAAGAAGVAAGAAGVGSHGVDFPRADATAGLPGEPSHESSSFGNRLSDSHPGHRMAPRDVPSHAAGQATERIPGGLAAAGSAAAGVAGAIGDKVGSFARAAADKAAARAAERRSAHDDFEGEDIALADALDEAPTTRLEPALPVFGRDTPEAPSGAQSRIALAIVGVLVLVALVIGINNVAKIGQHDGPAAAVTVTKTRPPSTTPQPGTSTQAPSTTSQAPPALAVSITGGKGFDPQDGNEVDQNVDEVYDGSTGPGWRSRWYGTPRYNGDKDGVGVLLDLSAPTVVKSVDLVLPVKQNVTVYATDSDSTDSLEGAQEVGSMKNAEGTVTINAEGTLKPASRLIVLITKAGPAETDGRYRAQINEVTVR